MVEFRISTDEKVSKCDILGIGKLQLLAKISLGSVVHKKIVNNGDHVS